jgi:hypothetical protein
MEAERRTTGEREETGKGRPTTKICMNPRAREDLLCGWSVSEGANEIEDRS